MQWVFTGTVDTAELAAARLDQHKTHRLTAFGAEAVEDFSAWTLTTFGTGIARSTTSAIKSSVRFPTQNGKFFCGFDLDARTQSK
jgi:hypothetical protein